MKLGGDTFLIRLVYLTAALLIGTIVVAGGVSGATNVSFCQTISQNGTYILNTSLNNASTCITIDSSDVVFDGGGFTINGTTGNQFGVYVFNSSKTLTNVSIKNLIVTNWERGIYIVDTENSTAINNTATSNTFYGIQLTNSLNITIKENNVSSNTHDGIYLISSSENTLLNNNASLNIRHGIYIEASSNNNTIASNNASSNGDIGLNIQSSSNNNTIINNIAETNNYGIFLKTSNNTILNNTVNSNEITGILLSGSDDNILENNSANSNTFYGIYLESFSDKNTISGNNASSNRQYGIHLQVSSNNTIINNIADSNLKRGISLQYSSDYNTITDNQAFDNSYGIFLYGVTPGGVTNFNNITRNNISSGFYGIQLFGSNYNNLLNNNIAKSVYHGISLHNISSYNNISNNSALNSYFGVYLSLSDNNTVTDNDLDSSYYLGVALRNSSGNYINGSGTVGNFTKDVFGVRLYGTRNVQSVTVNTNANYTIVFENLGNLVDTFNIAASGDGDFSLFCRPTSPCSDVYQRPLLFSGDSDERTLNVSSANVGAYHVNITVTSQGNTTVFDTYETVTIVHDGSHPDSAIITSAITPSSTIYFSVIENSTITNSNISYSEIYNSNVINSNLENVVLWNSLVINDVITNGTIKIGRTEYNITRNVSLNSLIIGDDEEDSTLFGMTEANKTLDFNSSNSNVSFRIATGSDYIGGTLTVQRSTYEPSEAENQSGNVGGYSWITPSTNIETGMDWVYMQIYYNESELGGTQEEDLRFQFYNTTSQAWEYLNKTFVEDFTTDSSWTIEKENWTVTADERYNGSSVSMAIAVINETTTENNTYIQVSFNITNATQENGLVIFSYSNTSSFYYAGIRNHTTYTTKNLTHITYYTNSTFGWVIGYYDGTWNDYNYTTEAINATQNYYMEFLLRGNYAVLTANGQKKASYILATVPVGNLGLAVYNTTNYFDNFVVYHPDSGVNTAQNFIFGNSTHFSVYGGAASVFGVSASVYGAGGAVLPIGAGPVGPPPTVTSPTGGDPTPSLFTGIIKVTSATYLTLVRQFNYFGETFFTGESQLWGFMGVHDTYWAPPEYEEELNAITHPHDVENVEGDVYAIAAEKALLKYPLGTDTVIISRGDLGLDSLAATAYAWNLDIPILLVEPVSVPDVTSSALQTLSVSSTIVVGGPDAVADWLGPDLFESLRIDGNDRYETAVLLANALMERVDFDTLIITDGLDPDGTAVMVASFYDAPIIYVRGDEVPEVTRKFLASNKFRKVILVGVSDEADAEIRKIVG
jgi:parallel beta-helix repeat protein